MSNRFSVNVPEDSGLECMLLIRLTRVRRNDKFPSVGITGDLLVGGIHSVDFNGLRIYSTEVEVVNYKLSDVSRNPLRGGNMLV